MKFKEIVRILILEGRILFVLQWFEEWQEFSYHKNPYHNLSKCRNFILEVGRIRICWRVGEGYW